MPADSFLTPVAFFVVCAVVLFVGLRARARGKAKRQLETLLTLWDAAPGSDRGEAFLEAVLAYSRSGHGWADRLRGALGESDAARRRAVERLVEEFLETFDRDPERAESPANAAWRRRYLMLSELVVEVFADEKFLLFVLDAAPGLRTREGRNEALGLIDELLDAVIARSGTLSRHVVRPVLGFIDGLSASELSWMASDAAMVLGTLDLEAPEGFEEDLARSSARLLALCRGALATAKEDERESLEEAIELLEDEAA